MDTRPRERRWRRCLQRILLLGENGSLAVDRVPKTIEHAAEQFGSHLDAQPASRCNDLTARSNALHLTDGHEQHAALTKADDLSGDRGHSHKMRAHVAEFPHRDSRSLRLNDESDDL